MSDQDQYDKAAEELMDENWDKYEPAPAYLFVEAIAKALRAQAAAKDREIAALEEANRLISKACGDAGSHANELMAQVAALTKELQEARVKIQEDLEWFKKMRASYEKERDRLRITLYFYASGNVESIRGELARNTLAASQEKKP